MSDTTSQEPADSAPLSGAPWHLRLLPARSGPVVALILVFAAAESVFSCFLPLGVRYFLDTVLGGRNRAALQSLFLLTATALFVSLAGGFLGDFLLARLRGRSMAALRDRIFRRLQNLSLQSRAGSGKRRLPGLSGRLGRIEGAFSGCVSRGLLPLVTALFSTALMLRLDWRAGLGAVILWPWVLLAPSAMAASAECVRREAGERKSGVLGMVEQSLSALPLIRAFAVEHMSLAVFRGHNEALARSAVSVGLRDAFRERFMRSGVLFGQVFVLGLSLWLVFARSMTPGSMVSLVMLAALAGASLLALADYMPVFAAARQALRAIESGMSDTHAVVDAPDARLLPPFSSEIVFSSVVPAARPAETGDSPPARESATPRRAASGVSLRIPKGTYAAFVGPSGAGKSAMLTLLMRFEDPAGGRITIDGHDLRHVTQASLRAQLGVVLQDGFVFDATIRENIRMGLPAATEEAISAAAAAAGMAAFIGEQPAGLDTPVGASGVPLSGEMTQRLALSRAILRHPPILLLDEIASALDPAEEASVNQTLKELAASATLITVTHRLSSAAGAERIFVFDAGEVVEQGSHFELMALNGVYAALWRKQAGFRFSPDGRHVDVDAQRLRAIPILEKLSEPILAELAPYFATETFAAGRDIVCQNDPGDKFYIIARGKVEVWRTEEQSGRSTCVNVLNDGDFFGEITLLTGFPRTATVRTVAVTTCLSLERGQFTRLIDRFPDLKRELSGIAVQRLRDSAKRASGGRA